MNDLQIRYFPKAAQRLNFSGVQNLPQPVEKTFSKGWGCL